MIKKRRVLRIKRGGRGNSVCLDMHVRIVLLLIDYFFCPKEGIMIVVTHRPDQLLQRRAKEILPPSVRGTFVERVTIPTHAALLAFLENDKQPVIGRHADFENLQHILEMWPEFASEKGLLELDKGFDAISIIREMQALATPGGMGGPFVVAMFNVLG